MLMPSYLAYAGWGLARAPGTWLGDAILRGPRSAAPGGNWYPQFASDVQAIAGLVLWVWPLAALVLASRLRRIDRAVLDTLRLEATRPWSRVAMRLALSRGAIAAAIAVVMLLMLGSAVPLHVAQLDTYAVHLWRALDETPHAERARVWIAAWPSLALAIVGALALARSIDAQGSEDQPANEPLAGPARSRWIPLAWTLAALALSLLVPIALFAANLRDLASLRAFWALSSGAIGNSLLVAGCVAIVGLAIACAAWFAWANVPVARPFLVLLSSIFLVAGLLPGVLIGAATREAWDAIDQPWARAFGDSWSIVVAGHLARFAFLPFAVGLVLARNEPRVLADLRRIDAGASLRAWAIAGALPALPILLGVALVLACLSFHEIESAVMLEPPSASGGSFARVMLQQLHFNRTNELAAGVLITVAGSVALALLACGLLRKRR